MYKTIEYVANLFFFTIFLYSVNKLADESPKYIIIMLVLSTIGLCIAFWHHTMGERDE